MASTHEPYQEGIRDFLARKNSILVLDGALSTALEELGCDLNDSLWSGKMLLDSPESIQRVEELYFEAGARVSITASYQVTPQSLVESRGLSSDEATAAIARSVKLARAARRSFRAAHPEVKDPLYVAGSVGPYGAYLADGSEYRGDYKRTACEFEDFHRSRIAALVEAGADLIAIETQPCAAEVCSILELMEREFPDVPCWVSFTVREPDNGMPVTCLSDGTTFSAIVPRLNECRNVIALGVNCIPLRYATPVLEQLERLTTKPLVVYPNSGETYHPDTKTWHLDAARLPNNSSTLAGCAAEWQRHGARLIGGCCRTLPRDIALLAEEIHKETR